MTTENPSKGKKKSGKKGKKAAGKRRRNPLRLLNPINLVRALNPFKGNPTGTAIAAIVGLAAAGVGAGYGIRHVVRKRREKKALEVGGVDAEAAKYVVPGGSTIASSPMIVSDVAGPINLSRTGDMEGYTQVNDLEAIFDTEPTSLEYGSFAVDGQARRMTYRTVDGNVGENVVTANPSIGYLVVYTPADVTQAIYEFITMRVAGGAKWNDAVSRSALLYDALDFAMSDVDWKASKPFTAAPDSAVARIWDSAELVGTIAYQSYWNKKALNLPVPQPEPPDSVGLPSGLKPIGAQYS